MPLTDTDLDLLETYLDGELPISEAEGLWRRLADEQDLTSALDELRAGRALRLAVFENSEPSDLAAAELSRRVSGSVHRRRWWESARRGLYYAGAAAACVLVGFQFGHLGTAAGGFPSGGSSGAAPTQIVQGAMTPSPAAYPVAIHDQIGNLVGVQPFASRQDAVDFVNDLNTSQQQSHSGQRDLGTNVVPASDEQF